MRKISIISLLILFSVSCRITKSNQTKIESKLDIIFSTQDLDSTINLFPNEFPLKCIGHDGKIYNNDDPIIRLPDYKDFQIVIWIYDSAGDDIPYALCVVKSGIMMLNKSLSITPRWYDVGNDENNYLFKKFIIYKNYIIRIDTEEKAENKKVKKFTKYYRINDNGEFYEVKIGEIKQMLNVMGWKISDEYYNSWKNAVNGKFGSNYFNVPQIKYAVSDYKKMTNKDKIRLQSVAQYGLTMFWKEVNISKP